MEAVKLAGKLPVGFWQLFMFASVGMALIGHLTWRNYRRPQRERSVLEFSPVLLLLPFEIIAVAVLVEWAVLLVLGQGMDLPLHSH
ncbi:MAG: hypothetical protein QF384_01000 [Alphaproteobacteria bacterium]|nr:hypothetical protein [Alphaproteobacteria bacterium]MDP6830538.1 hypothetical protein [Alphaproteobacteria bacterium]